MSQAATPDRSITVGRDAVNSVFTSGDGNTVIVYQTVAAVATPLAGGKNPYLGLLAFTEADADRFFGREELVSTLWERFRNLLASPSANEAPRLLAILGPSGSGKSSLARAGLVPELARRPIGARRQRMATMTPGVQPLTVRMWRRQSARCCAGLSVIEGETLANVRSEQLLLGDAY